MKKKLFTILGIILVAVVLVACGKKTYEVSFDVDGGTPAVTAQKVEEGKLAKTPTPAPTKAGFELEGWFLGDKEWNFASDKVTKKITLVAQWKEVSVVKFTVTFDTDGGTPSINPVEVESGKPVSAPTAPTKAGHAFLGWYLGEDLYVFATNVTANITLKAKWQADTGDKYEVVFDVRGGTPAMEPVLVEAGEKVTKPADPTRDGFNFGGWQLDGKEFDFETPITDDIRLMAVWNAKVYVNIMLIADGGEPAPESPVQHEKGTLFAEPAEMTKEGYEFVGWFNQATDEEFNFAVPVEAGFVLVAKWERVYKDFTVSFDINYDEGEEVPSQTVREELFATEPEVERVGYRLLGWFEVEATEAFDFSAMILADVHLVARWHLEYVVSFDINYDEGTNPASVLVLDGDKVNEPATPVREFYQFDGWFLDGEIYDFEAVVEEDLNLVAQWTELETYMVTYNNVTEDMFVYGTQEAMFEAYITDFHEFTGSSFTLAQFMHAAGQTTGFNGLWVELKAQIYNGPKPAEGEYNDSFFATSTKYKDKWMPFHDMIHEFVLLVNDTQFFWGSGTWTGLIRLEQFIKGTIPGGNEAAEDMLMMPNPLVGFSPIKEHLGIDAIALPNPYRVDGIFEGWYLDADFSGEAITEIPADTKENVQVYAKWTEIVSYDVTFDIGYTEGVSPDVQTILEGYKAVEPSEPARRAGFRFEGWFEEDAADAFDFTAPIMGSVALTAKWREVVEYEVTFDYDMDDVEDLIEWVEQGLVIPKPVDPVRENHHFLGWFLVDATEAFDFETIITEDTVLTAHWEELSVFSITYNLPEGAELFAGFSTRNEMLQAFMEDFYAFLVAEGHLTDETITANDFIHGKDKTSGFDGMYLLPAEATSYFQHLYVAGNTDVAPETGAFLNQAVYHAKWFPLMEQINEFSDLAGDAGFFASKFIGYRRFKEYLQGKNLWSGKAEEAALIFATIPSHYAVPRHTYNTLDDTFYLPQASHPILNFNGWYDNPEFTGEPIVTIQQGSTGNLDLYANFGVPLERYKVEYSLGYDDLTLPEVHINEGNKVPKPTDPSRYLYKFLGWKLEGEEDLFDFETIITGDVKLVAVWEELEPMTVSFDLGYVGAEEMDDVIVGEGTTVAKPADPVREGFVFLGWYIGEDAYDFDLPVETDLTLVALWEDAPFELTYNLGEGHLSAADVALYMDNTHIVATRYSASGDTTGKPITIGSGRGGLYWHTMAFKDTATAGVYELIGKGTGYTNEAATLYISYHDSVAGDYAAALKSLYAAIAVGRLVVVPTLPPAVSAETHVDMYFLSVGATIPTSLSVIPAEVEELITPVRDGYTFVGWYDNAELSGEALVEVPTLTDDLTVYPKWERNLPKLENAGFTVDSNGNLVFTLEASGADLYSLEIDHNFEGILPEFTVYADNDSIWGTPGEDPADYGVAATYLNGVWTITFTKDGTAYNAFLNGGKSSLAFYFVIANDLGDEWGSMFEVTPENTREIDIVTVSFDIEGADQILFAGDKAVEPATPTKEGFLFGGWFVGEEEFNFSTAVTENILITALWNNVATVEVTFNLNYEGAEPMASVVIEENTAVTKPADPVRTGYDFLGWFVAEAEVAYDFSALVAADLALEARWLLIEMFTISYELDGGNLYLYNTREEMVADFIADYNAFKNKTLTAEGFQAGTYGQNVFEIFTSEVYGAKWIWMRNYIIQVAGDQAHASKSQLEADEDGNWRGTIDSFLNATVRTAWPASADYTNEPAKNGFWPLIVDIDPIHEYQHGYEFVLPVPEKDQADFLGWYLDAEFSDEAITVISPEERENITLYAKWSELAFYTVTFDTDGGNAVASQEIQDGSLVIEPEHEPYKIDYLFAGWYLEEVLYNFDLPVTENITIVAKWDAVVNYNITYELDGGVAYYETKAELIDGFLEDFYAYLGLTIHMSEFKHGVGKTFGYDGLWHSTYKAQLYAGPTPTEVDENYFISSAEYMEKWLPFFNTVDDFVKVVNPAQFFWDNRGLETPDPSVGLIRIRQYVINLKPAGFITEEQMQMMPEEKIEKPVVTVGIVGVELPLPILYKEDVDFLGWYLDAEFSGEPITKISADQTEALTLYAKWTADVQLPEMIIDWDFGTVAKTGYDAGDLTWTNSDSTEVTANKDRAQINTSNYAPHNDGHFLVLSIRNTASEAWIELDFTTLTGMNKISFEINVWNNTLLATVKDTPNGLFILQVKDGENWVNIETTNAEANLLPLLTLEEYVEVAFDVAGPGLYRIMYSGASTETSNTRTAVTVDNLKVFK